MIKRTLIVLAVLSMAVAVALPAFAAAERDLKTEPADFIASGNSHQDRLGRSLAFGDIDNDGFADMATGAPLDEPDAEEPEDNRGALHVYFGKAGFSGTSSSPDLIIWGEEGCTPGTGCSVGNNDLSDVLGKGVAMGDVDDDGKDDLIVSAVRAKAVAGAEGGRLGKVYIFFNRGRTGWNAVDGESAAEADVTIVGDFHQNDFGIHIDTGDFDDDGIVDIVAGAAAVHPVQPGTVWVLYGRKTWPSSIELDEEPPPAATLEVIGATVNDMLGHAVAAGDLNGDGIADIAAGAPFGTGGCGAAGTPAGKAYVLFGTASRQTGTVAMANRADVTIESDDDGDELGRRLAIGNVGGGRTTDLILGAPCGDAAGKTDNGVGYVLFGKLTAGTKSVDDAANLIVFGEDAEDGLGVGTGAGDITGDGKPDLILGAEGGDGPDETRTDAGEAAVLFGPVPKGTRDLANVPAHLTVYGDDKGDHLGLFVGAGNVNGARGADLGLTAPVGSGITDPPQPQAGEVHVLTDPCTLTGTAGADVLEGTGSPDVICGLGGNDVLKGLGGKDVLFGGGGKDTLNGGKGNDVLRGQGGNDTILGKGGKDDAKGGAGKDTVKGGAGKDTVKGNGGNDNLKGNAGNDTLKGGPGDDVLNGGPGTDVCKPGKGNDVVKNCEK